MGRDSAEDNLYQVVSRSLRSWLQVAREAVMRPWVQHRLQPDPSGVYQVQDAWTTDVDSTILSEIGKIAFQAWSEATDVPVVSRHAFVISQLAQTRNFLVNIPDEVYNLVFEAIIDSVNGGGDIEATAAAVDDVLTWTGSPNWPGRSRNIAVTETTRAYGAGTLGAGMEQSRVTGRLLRKRWDTEKDKRVRATHRHVDGQVLGLTELFNVGGYGILYPGDPMGPADEVCGCRCDLVIVNEERGR